MFTSQSSDARTDMELEVIQSWCWYDTGRQTIPEADCWQKEGSLDGIDGTIYWRESMVVFSSCYTCAVRYWPVACRNFNKVIGDPVQHCDFVPGLLWSQALSELRWHSPCSGSRCSKTWRNECLCAECWLINTSIYIAGTEPRYRQVLIFFCEKLTLITLKYVGVKSIQVFINKWMTHERDMPFKQCVILTCTKENNNRKFKGANPIHQFCNQFAWLYFYDIACFVFW